MVVSAKMANLVNFTLKKALAVTKLEPPTRKPEPVAKVNYFTDYDLTILAQCDLFNVSHFNLHGNCNLKAKKR